MWCRGMTAWWEARWMRGHTHAYAHGDKKKDTHTSKHAPPASPPPRPTPAAGTAGARARRGGRWPPSPSCPSAPRGGQRWPCGAGGRRRRGPGGFCVVCVCAYVCAYVMCFMCVHRGGIKQQLDTHIDTYTHTHTYIYTYTPVASLLAPPQAPPRSAAPRCGGAAARTSCTCFVGSLRDIDSGKDVHRMCLPASIRGRYMIHLHTLRASPPLGCRSSP